MKIILLGAPGSGKGTQAAHIAEKCSVPHISTGDIFRENIKNKTPLGIKVKEIIDNGNFCPDDLTCELVKNRLSENDCENGYLLDGFPRNLYQAKALDEFSSPDMVIELKVDLDRIERRITGRRNCSKCGASFHTDFIGERKTCEKCGGELSIRKDDTPETVRTRLKVYAEQTEPLVEYYYKQNKLFVVDGNGDIESVKKDIFKALDI
ncbi:MAG: adenylate kinase [Candidatus Borkfalkiaceae bacterium]|nr:adenylate kinase [Christensenellaceae bacterium]